ncbi:MAG: AI-2E family transporter [Phycisphaerales bacterium]
MPDSEPSNSSREAPTMADAFRRLHLWQIQGIRDIVFGLGVFGVFWLGYKLSAVTVPLLLGLLLAYLFEPLVRWLSRFRWCPRPVAAVGILTVVGGTLVLALALATPLAIGQAVSLIETLRSGKVEARAVELIDQLPDQYQSDARRGAAWIFGHPIGRDGEVEVPATQPSHRETSSDEAPAESEPPKADGERPVEIEVDPALEADARPVLQAADSPRSWSMLGLAGSGLRTLYEAVIGTFAFLLALVLIPFYFYYFSVSYPSTIDFLGSLVPEPARPRTFELFRKMDNAVAGFVRGRIVISVIMGTMLAIGWLIVGVPYAILLGAITGVLCAVPYLGGVGVPLAIGLLALENAGLPEAERMGWGAVILWPSVVFGIVQLFEGYILTPVIAGKATDLSPLAIFVAVLAGGAMAGIYGMLLSIPVAACLKIVIVEVLLPRIKAWTRGEASDPLPVDNGG